MSHLRSRQAKAAAAANAEDADAEAESIGKGHLLVVYPSSKWFENGGSQVSFSQWKSQREPSAKQAKGAGDPRR